MSKTVYYLRKGKQYNRDYEEFLKAGASPDDIFSDRIQDRKKTGSDYNRIKQVPDLERIIVPTIVALGSSDREIHNELEWFVNKGVVVSAMDIPDSMDPKHMAAVTRALCFLYAGLARRETKKLRDNQPRPGKPPLPYPDNWDDIYRRWQTREQSVKELIDESGMKRATFYNMVAKYEKEISEKRNDPSDKRVSSATKI